jgi:hypothetical protein
VGATQGQLVTTRLDPAAVEAIAERAAAIVLDRLNPERPPSQSSPYMTIPEAAEYLRCSRSGWTTCCRSVG